MYNRHRKALILASTVLCTLASVSSADTGAYMGFGLSTLELDGPGSENISFTAGYYVYESRFESTRIQSVKLGIEGQYSDSISGTDNASNYSVFGGLRAHTSDQIYLKVKQGFTEFLGDFTTMNKDGEHSHFGVGVGVGYEMQSGFIEVEYIRPNESIHASIFEISYKFHF